MPYTCGPVTGRGENPERQPRKELRHNGIDTLDPRLRAHRMAEHQRRDHHRGMVDRQPRRKGRKVSKATEIRKMQQGDHRVEIRVGGRGTRDARCSCGWYAAGTSQRAIEDYARRHLDLAYHPAI